MLLEKMLGISHHYTVFPASKEALYFMLQHFLIAYIVGICMRNHHFSVKEVLKEFFEKLGYILLTGICISLFSYALLILMYNLSNITSTGLKLVASAFNVNYLNNLIPFASEVGFYLLSMMIYNLIPILSACILSKDTKRSLKVVGIFLESQRLIAKKIIDYAIYFVSSRLIIYCLLTMLLELVLEKNNINPLFVYPWIYPCLTMLEILSEIYILNFFMHIGDKHYNEVYIDEIKAFNHKRRKIDKIFKDKFEMVGIKAFYLILIYTLSFSLIRGLILHLSKDNIILTEILEVSIDIIQFGLILRAVHKSIKYPNYNIRQVITMNIKSISYVLPIAILIGVVNAIVIKPTLIFLNTNILKFEPMLSSPVFMIISILIWFLIVSTLVIMTEVVILSIYGMEIERDDNLNPIKVLMQSGKGLGSNKTDFIKFILNNTIDILSYIAILQLFSKYTDIDQLTNIINYAVFILKAVFMARLSISVLIFTRFKLRKYISKDDISFFEI